MTDLEAIEQFKAALEEIRETPNKWGEIVIIVSGGDVKHVNVTKPPKQQSIIVNRLTKPKM